MKSYNHLNSNYKREKTLKLKYSLYLKLGSLRSGEEWILFFVDRVNVIIFWESSLQIMDRVAQLLSNKISKRLRQKLELSKLVEEFNSLSVFLSWKFWPLFNSKLSYQG